MIISFPTGFMESVMCDVPLLATVAAFNVTNPDVATDHVHISLNVNGLPYWMELHKGVSRWDLRDYPY